MGALGTYLPYLIILAGVYLAYLLSSRRKELKSQTIKAAALELGTAVPISLHPVIDASLCLGCGNCARACPEGDVLGVINGKAELIEPSHCIGHGACKTSCPTSAIRLVFGSAERGIDLPVVGPDFQSNVPGIFIAGELGGMGLVRNAIEQGRQAVDALSKIGGFGHPERTDVVIVGAGPAGISGALAAKQHGLKYVVVEQDDLGGTVFKYPRGKIVMTAPAKLPIVGEMKFSEVGKEKLLAYWQNIEKTQELKIRYREKVEKIEPVGDGFTVSTSKSVINTRAVLLAIGRRGSPRQLGVKGEDLPKVVYQLIDPEQYKGKHVLIVGGGDSALEAAGSIAQQPGTKVTLSYRGKALARARTKNRDLAHALRDQGKLSMLMESQVAEVRPACVLLESGGHVMELKNDAVIVCAGGELPTQFLRQSGVALVTKYGTE